jgi:hypothetical protein
VVFDEMIAHLGALCAHDAACSSRTSDLAQTIYDVNHNMPRRWLGLTIDPDTVRLGTHFTFMKNGSMAATVDAYLAAAEGDASGLALMNLMIGPMMSDEVPVLGDQMSKGGADMHRYRGLESISLEDTALGAPLSEFVWPLMDAWPPEPVPVALQGLQESDVEMLLVNGTVDFSTPPTALAEVAPYYHRAQMVLLPEFSHTEDVYTLQQAAYERLITSYYDTGVADSSLYVYEPLSFTPGLSLTLLAKVLAAVVVGVPVLLVAGVVVAVRRRRPGAADHHSKETDTLLAMRLDVKRQKLAD